MSFAYRVFRAVSRRVKASWAVRRDDRLGTYGPNCQDQVAVRLKPLPGGLLRAREADILDLSAACLVHRFDVLGSGPVEIHHGLHCRGFEGHVYTTKAVPSTDPDGYWLAGIINTSNLAEARKKLKKFTPKANSQLVNELNFYSTKTNMCRKLVF